MPEFPRTAVRERGEGRRRTPREAIRWKRHDARLGNNSARAGAPRRLAAAGREGRFGTLRPLRPVREEIIRGRSVPKRGCRSRRHPEAWSNPRILGFLDQDAIESDGLGSRSGSCFSLWTGEERRPATRCLSMDGGRHPGWSRPPPALPDPRNAPFLGGGGRGIGIFSGCVKGRGSAIGFRLMILSGLSRSLL